MSLCQKVLEASLKHRLLATLTQEVWGVAWESVFLMSSHVLLCPASLSGTHFENCHCR